MFQLVIVIVFVGVVAARPTGLETQTSLEAVGSIVGSVPTSITHQSQTVIHDQAQIGGISGSLLGGQEQFEQFGGESYLNGQGGVLDDQNSLTGGDELLLRGGDYQQGGFVGNSETLAFGSDGVGLDDSRLFAQSGDTIASGLEG